MQAARCCALIRASHGGDQPETDRNQSSFQGNVLTWSNNPSLPQWADARSRDHFSHFKNSRLATGRLVSPSPAIVITDRASCFHDSHTVEGPFSSQNVHTSRSNGRVGSEFHATSPLPHLDRGVHMTSRLRTCSCRNL